MDDDEFSDDEALDSLPANVLQELENTALQFTQTAAAHRGFAASQAPPPLPPPLLPPPPAFPPQRARARTPPFLEPTQPNDVDAMYGDLELEDDDLDTTEVTNELQVPVGRPVVDKSLPQTAPVSASALARPTNSPWQDGAARNQMLLSSRPRFPAAIPPPSQSFQRAAAAPPAIGQNRPAPSQFVRLPPPPPPPRPPPPPLPPPHPPASHYQPPQLPQPPPSQQPHMAAASFSQAPPTGHVTATLLQRVRALEADLNAARGEASILRSNATKQQKVHDDEVARLKRQTAEQAAERERLVEAAVAAEKNANTELQFLRQDMREVSHQAARLRQKSNGSESGAGGGGGVTTPRRSLAAKTWAVADGFDDVEMAPPMASPRKTPRGKRKRPVADSPVKSLETHAVEDVLMGGMGQNAVSTEEVLAPPLATGGVPTFEFLRFILDHATHHNPPTLDVLSRFSFPSDPTTSLSQLILHKLPLMGDPFRPMQLLVDFAELVISLWGTCHDEQLLEPVWFLVSLLTFILQLHVMSVAPLVTRNFMPVAVSSIYAAAEPRSRGLEPGVPVDSTQVLGVMLLLALACASAPVGAVPKGGDTPQAAFWKLVPLEFVGLLLTPKQHPEDMVGALDLLCTSVLPGSIGPVVEGREPSAVARLVIDRVSAQLTEQPRWAATPTERHGLRLAALRTMGAFVTQEFGAMEVAAHDTAIPRIVSLLSTSLDEIYDLDIAPRPQALSARAAAAQSDSDAIVNADAYADANAGADADADAADRLDDDPEGLYRIISQATALLHRLVTDPRTESAADVGAKLAVAHGGQQRYVVALARLNFAEEDLVLEAGIGVETMTLAHELLEMAVTPDEGERIGEAFVPMEE